MKIFAIAQNYRDHLKEMMAKESPNPVIFMKPDTALLRNNKPFYLPDFSEEIHYETELLLRINKIGKNIQSRFSNRYFAEIGLGIDFTARDLQQKLKNEGKPWEISKSFDNSAVISNFISIREFENIQKIEFRLDINGETVQKGNSSDMIFSMDELIAHISRFFTIKIGDIIFTGTPSGVGKICIGDRLEGYIFDRKMFDFCIK